MAVIDAPYGQASRIRHLVVPYTRGRGLDLGCGREKLWPHFIGIDNGSEWNARVGDLCHDARNLEMFADASMDFVHASHLLDTFQEGREKALAEWWRVLAPERYLVLYGPEIGADGLVGAMEEIAQESRCGWTVVENETHTGMDDREKRFLVFRKHRPVTGEKKPKTVHDPWRKPDKALLIIRYGAYGDQLMVSSVLPWLKEQGWHITYNTSPRGQEVIKHDPHIDAWWLQDKDQVPNHQLRDYWRYLEERYDRVINLSESVESELLPPPGHPKHAWEVGVRQKILGTVNYLERTHDLCSAPHDFRPKFFPTPDERAWARAQAKRLRGKQNKPLILWTTGGSSVHKVWPHLDQVLARLMLTTEATVILTGDDYGKLAEHGWENEPRVVKTCGEWPIRKSLAMAQQVDVVVGPETGILNAVCMEPSVAKVVYLSHSSAENLTKHWVDTTVLESRGCPESPCHRLHYSFEHCHRHEETGAALCAASLGADEVTQAILAYIAPKRERAA